MMDKEVHATESPLASFSETMQEMMRNVRLAIPNKIKPEDPNVLATIKLDDLEKLKQFRQRNNDFEEDYDYEDDDTFWEFVMSNVDVDIEGLEVCIRFTETETDCHPFDRGMDLTIATEAGTEVRVVAPDGREIKKITTEADQEQVIISSLNTKW
mmetsp:Transcript_28626/g.42880  ORF Transcript_28626/g.42880 Transcript_28626/m.42880 type:complete len:155 (-) Transcript_28626:392-856(-)